MPEAPQSVPFVYQVCCILESSESGVEMTSSCAGSSTKRSCQHPGPKTVGVVVSLMHCPSGKSPGFWSDLGGTTYV